MEEPLCKLTIAFPPAAEDLIVNLVLTSDPPLRGFTTLSAEGHGEDFSTATIQENVKGRVRRSLMVLILPRRRATALLDEIREKAAIPRLVYWTEAVEDFGRLD